MTTASHIIHTARNANEAMLAAEALTDDISQNWEDESTTYVFEDKSILVVSGPSLNAYKDGESQNHELT